LELGLSRPIDRQAAICKFRRSYHHPGPGAQAAIVEREQALEGVVFDDGLIERDRCPDGLGDR
jgi:hypothetical protein